MADVRDQLQSALGTAYALERELGGGGMSRVFVATEAALGLGEQYETRGDRARATAHYAAFVDLWKKVDPELQPAVAEARRRLAELADAERH